MLPDNKKFKVAYITTSFSTVSHTFIRREVQALIDHGVEVGLYGVRPDRSSNINFLKVSYLYPLNILNILIAFIKLIFKKPLNLFKGFISASFNEELNPYQHLKLIYHFILSWQHSADMLDKKYDHIHAHFTNVPTTIAMYCSMLTDIPFSFTCHSGGEFQLREVIAVKQKVRSASFVRLISEYLRNDLKNLLSYNSKIEIVRCGLDFSKAELNKTKSIVQPSKLLAVGRLVEKKGFSILIDAAEILKQDNYNFEVNIIGEGPLYNELVARAETKKVSDKVNFLLAKTESEVQAYLKSSDLLIVPSVTSATGEKEGIPTVIIESMRESLPVVASRHSGIPELVIDRETGLLFEEGSSKALAKAVKELLSTDALKQSIVETAFKKSKEMYDQENITKRLIELFGRDSSGKNV